jgi:general stress protein 26
LRRDEQHTDQQHDRAPDRSRLGPYREGRCRHADHAFRGGLRARPLEARPDREGDVIWFLTDVRSGKDEEVAASPEVGLVFIDAGDKAYLSITGRAEILRDTAQAAEIWKSSDQVWWPGGPDDPTLRVLRVEPRTAELWDGPSNSVVAAFEFAKAKLTGTKPNLGENRKVTVPMR